jgi:tRNA-2-methylthio-N6-dimethylallyladenosine synthase
MRRSYNSSHFLKTLDMVRDYIPEMAVTTDIIVGFPGETDADFEETMRVVEAAQFSMAYTFQYSIRPNTPAGEMENQIPKAVVQERFERLLELQNAITLKQQQAQEGKTLEVMVSALHGRKDAAHDSADTLTLSGHTRDARLVHFSVPTSSQLVPGDLVDVKISHAAPFHLLGSAL